MNGARIAICTILAGGALAFLGAAPLRAQETPSGSDSPGVERASRPDDSPSPKRLGKGIRTLDEITIEGEVAVPQVLFITARDRPRYEDRLHRRYLRGSLDLARTTPLPEHFGVRFRTLWEETP
jgi:hypothetical protein